MELVSSFLENILVVEQPKGAAQSKVEADPTPQTRRLSVAVLENGSEKDTPILVPETPKSNISRYWYLEDTKVANQLVDRVMEKVLSVMINGELEKPLSALEGRIEMQKSRPPLLVNLMSMNSTQLAQKTSPMFEGIDACIMFFTWYNPYFTIAWLMVVTHVILNPYLATTAPCLILLHKFLVPSYLKLYPPDRSQVDGVFFEYNPVPHTGKPLNKYEAPKVISQFSREFVMNFTDMQNHQVGYIRLYDGLVNWGQHYFLFEDRDLSTIVFLVVIATVAAQIVILPWVIPLAWKYLPLRSMTIAMVWATLGVLHPSVKDKALDYWETEEARMERLDKTDNLEKKLLKFIATDDETETMKEAEIFELHQLHNSIWVPVGFSPDFFSLNHPKRVLPEENTDQKPSEDDDEDEVSAIPVFHRETLAEIRPPVDWVFAELLWKIDLDPLEWVTANCIMDLVSVDTDEKWVYDFVGETSILIRRRRWVRKCQREDLSNRRSPLDGAMKIAKAPSRDRLSKTFNSLIS